MADERKKKKPDQGVVKKSLWLTSGMAQAMVLLNGVILTLTAFFVLTYFVHQMSRDEYRKVSGDTGKYLVGSITNIENSMRFISGLILMSNIADRDVLSEQIRRNVPGLAQFDQIVWLYEASPGRWQYKTIFSSVHENIPEEGYTFKPDEALISRLVKGKIFDDDSLRTYTDFRGMNYAEESAEPKTMSRSFAFVKAVEEHNSSRGVIVGISRAVLLLERGWIAKESSVYRLTIRDKSSQRRVYHMSREGNAEAQSAFNQEYTFSVGNSEWQILFEFMKHKNLQFLELVPYLILVFGTLLTVVGTLFVRNNQRQSLKVSRMNETLEQKNFELESEVAERERLNEVLVKSERDHRAIIDSVNDIIFETDTEGQILFLSAAWKKTTGFDVTTAKGKDLFSMFHPEDQKRQRQDFDFLVKGQKQAYRSFTRMRTSDGTFRAVELSFSMIRQDESRQLRVVGTITDVEERRRAERALAEAEKKYRTIVENAAGGLYQLTPEGLYLSANPAMGRVLGYESVEDMLRLVRNANGDVYPDKDAREAFMMGLVKAGQIFGYETQVLRKDKSLIWVRENIRVVRDEDGHILYFEGSMEDITKRKEAELAMQQAKIESDMANRAKTEFIANMSHELRTPLNAIIGFSEIMKNQILGPLGQDMYIEYANDIHASGRGLLKIINDILDISRMEVGKRELKESEFPLEEALSSSMDILAGKVLEKNITVVKETNDLPDLLGEELAIKQAITSIYSNAIKFTAPGGRIRIFSNDDHDGGFRLSISDTGVGLTPEEVQKALSPFGQGDTSLDRSGSGVGLGLTLCQSIMKLHRGRLEILSEKGIGTTVTLTFPPERVFRQQAVQDTDGPDSLKKDGKPSETPARREDTRQR